jgi:hypothetical protein
MVDVFIIRIVELRLNLGVLATKAILNARRSGQMNEFVVFKADVNTPAEKIAQLKQLMQEHVRSNSYYYLGDCDIAINDFGTNNMMNFRISCQHKNNWQDGGLRWEVHTNFCMALMKNLSLLNINYIMPEQKVILEHPEK